LTRFEPPEFLALPGVRVRQRGESGDGFGPAALLAGGLSFRHEEFAQMASLFAALVRQYSVMRVFHLPVLELAGQLSVALALIAGDLVDPEVNIEVRGQK
jgi:hypothetical protein